MTHYILKDKKPLAVTLEEWARRFCEDGDDRRVARDELAGGVSVSTVFLGIDHNFSDVGPPVLFETMIFGGPHDEEQWRYTTWNEAVAGHQVAVELARAKP